MCDGCLDNVKWYVCVIMEISKVKLDFNSNMRQYKFKYYLQYNVSVSPRAVQFECHKQKRTAPTAHFSKEIF